MKNSKLFTTIAFAFIMLLSFNAEAQQFAPLDKSPLDLASFPSRGANKAIKVFYGEELVGEYFADLIVSEKVILELKAAEGICEQHENQLINYLKATDIEVGLLLNFGKSPEFKRKVFSNK